MKEIKKVEKKKVKILESIKNMWNTLNFIKIYQFLFILILLVSVGINISYINSPQKIVEKEVIVKKEVIKYVEKEGGTSTNKFIMYLNSRTDPNTAKIIADAIDKSSKKYSLPRKLILSIINKESFFNTLAKSHKDCVGLMQINPKAHKDKVKDIKPTHLYHIGINIDIGCIIFREYFDKSKGNLKETFHSYLGKKASNQQIEKYMNDILYTFAKLEMHEYSNEKEVDENGKEHIDVKKIINNSTVLNNDGVQHLSD